MTGKRFTLSEVGCYRTSLIVDDERKMGNTEVVDVLNNLYEEKQYVIQLAKIYEGRQTRLRNYLKFKYGVSNEKLMEIMTNDKWLGEYDDDGNLVIKDD